MTLLQLTYWPCYVRIRYTLAHTLSWLAVSGESASILYKFEYVYIEPFAYLWQNQKKK